MLIPSFRHKQGDLELWQQFEQADLVLGKPIQTKVKQSIDHISKFHKEGLVGYCGVSWGKDSTVVAELCRLFFVETGFKIPLVFVRVEPNLNPDCDLVRDAFLTRWPNAEYHEIKVICKYENRNWNIVKAHKDGFKQANQQFGERRISGVRASESGERTLSARVHGVNSVLSCRPILYWQAKHVYSFLAVMGLPVHPAYAMLGEGRWDRDRIRVAALGGVRGDGVGRIQWEKEYYGDIIRELQTLKS